MDREIEALFIAFASTTPMKPSHCSPDQPQPQPHMAQSARRRRKKKVEGAHGFLWRSIHLSPSQSSSLSSGSGSGSRPNVQSPPVEMISKAPVFSDTTSSLACTGSKVHDDNVEDGDGEEREEDSLVPILNQGTPSPSSSSGSGSGSGSSKKASPPLHGRIVEVVDLKCCYSSHYKKGSCSNSTNNKNRPHGKSQGFARLF